jgi:hypothetical protein
MAGQSTDYRTRAAADSGAAEHAVLPRGLAPGESQSHHSQYE